MSFIKSHPVQDVDARIAWAAAERSRRRCYVCGISDQVSHWMAPVPGIQTHHLVGGAARSDEPCNMVRLCHRCHRIVHGDRIPKDGGGHLPEITPQNLLWVKREHDPEEFDLDRLTVLKRNRHRTANYNPLGDPEPLDEHYLRERTSWPGR